MASQLQDDNMGLPSTASNDEINLYLENLFKLIEKGEGGYDASNRGTIKTKNKDGSIKNSIVGSTNLTTRNGKKLSEMTLGEIKAYQAISDPNNVNRIFTAGRFQMIPEVIKEAQENYGMSDDTIFNADAQNLLGRYLVTKKRPKLGKFFSGSDEVSEEDAMIELAKEFASFPVPRDMRIRNGTDSNGQPKYRTVKKGQSYYGGANKSHHSLDDVRNTLSSVRGAIPINKTAPETSSRPQARPMEINSAAIPQAAVDTGLKPKARPADLQDPRSSTGAEGYGSVGGPMFDVPPTMGPFREGNPTLYPVPAPPPVTVTPIPSTPTAPQRDPRFEGVPVPRGVPDSPRLSDTFVGVPPVTPVFAEPLAVEQAVMQASPMQQVPQPTPSFNEAFAAGRAAAGGDGGTFMYNDKLYNTNLAKYNQGTSQVMPRYYAEGTGFVDFFKNLFGSNPNPVPGDMRGSPQGVSGLSAEQLAAANAETNMDPSAFNPNIIPVPAMPPSPATDPRNLGGAEGYGQTGDDTSRRAAAQQRLISLRESLPPGSPEHIKVSNLITGSFTPSMTSLDELVDYNIPRSIQDSGRMVANNVPIAPSSPGPFVVPPVLTEQDMLRQDNLQYLNEQLDDLNKRIVFMPSGSDGRAILQTQIDRIKGEIIGYGGTPEFNVPEAKQTGVNTGLITAENDLREANTELRIAKTSDEIAAAAAKAAAARDAINNNQTIPDLNQSIITAEDIKSVAEGKATIAEIDNQINNTVDPSLINALNRKKERVQADINAAQTNLDNEEAGSGRAIEAETPPVVEQDPAMDNREKVLNDLELSNNSGLSTAKDGKVTNKDGAVVGELTAPQVNAAANAAGSDADTLLGKLGPIFKALFGLETQDMTRALGFYLMSRASGASHEGSMRWAGGTVLKQSEQRRVEEKASAEQKRREELAAEIRQEGYDREDERYKVTDALAAAKIAATLKGNQQKLKSDIAKAYGDFRNTAAEEAGDLFGSGEDRLVNIPSNETISRSAVSWGQQNGYDLSDAETANDFAILYGQALQAMKQEAASNPNKKIGTLEGFLNQEQLKAWTAGTSNLWVLNPDEEDENKFEYVGSKYIQELQLPLKEFAQKENSTGNAIMAKLALEWAEMPAEQKRKYGTAKGRNGFYLFVKQKLGNT